MKVELDKKALFALASDSRMEILKALHPQRRTVAQLADQLGLDKAGVHRHLKKLEEGELVTRYEEHGFVYYGLSWKARDVISPGENTKIIIVFSVTLMMVVGAIAAILTSISTSAYTFGESQVNNGDPAGGADRMFLGNGISPEMMALGIILMIIAAILIYIGWRKVRAPKQRPSPMDGSTTPIRDEAMD